MDHRSQINRQRLRFWLWVLFMFWALFVAQREDTDAEGAEFTQTASFIAR